MLDASGPVITWVVRQPVYEPPQSCPDLLEYRVDVYSTTPFDMNLHAERLKVLVNGEVRQAFSEGQPDGFFEPRVRSQAEISAEYENEYALEFHLCVDSEVVLSEIAFFITNNQGQASNAYCGSTSDTFGLCKHKVVTLDDVR